MKPTWTTSLPDWESRIVNRQSIIPDPIFPDQADEAMRVMGELRLVDVAGQPKFGDIAAPWLVQYARAIFGGYDAESGQQLISESFLMVPKKQSKALALDTPIPTPSGWTTMGELNSGDVVLGSDGHPCNVIATSEIFTDHDCYEMTFSNGESVIADGGHLWETYFLDTEDTAIRTTEEISRKVTRRDGARKHSLKMPEPLMLPDADLPIAPYTLGIWLGDGTSTSAALTLHEDDAPHIIDRISEDGYPAKVLRTKGKSVKVSLSTGDRTQASRDASLTATLRREGLLNNKHIPLQYLRASYQQRLALLQGLMDSDGTIAKNGNQISIASVKKELAEGIMELLSTFGIKYSMTPRIMKISGRVVPGLAYTITFSTFSDHIPAFSLQRKLDRMKATDPTGYKPRCRTVHITSVEKIASVPVKCISVDSRNNLFLFGRTMLPTHNSTAAALIMLTALIRGWRHDAEYAIVAPTLSVAGNSFEPIKSAIRADKELSKLLHVQPNTRIITHRVTNAKLQVIAADSNSVAGKKLSGVLIDELWLLGKSGKSDDILRELTGGLAARPEGFLISLTTQGDEPPTGVFKTKLDYARGVRDGRIDDPSFLPVLYEFPKKMIESGEARNPKNFGIVNPSMGFGLSEDFLRRELKKATEAGEAELAGFFAKHANIEVGLALTSKTWSAANYFDKVKKQTTLDELLNESEVVTLGVDLGGLDDMTSIVVLGRNPSGKWTSFSHSWLFKDAVEFRKSNATKYQQFVKEGDLTIIENVGEDLDALVGMIEHIRDTGKLGKIGIDPHGTPDLLNKLQEIGLEANKDIVGVSQGWRLHPVIVTVERRLAERTLSFADQNIFSWALSNAAVEVRGNAMSINKAGSGAAKIDPVIALLCAVSVMLQNPASAGTFAPPMVIKM